MKTPENTAEYLHIITNMSRTELKVLNAFLWFFKERVAQNHKETYPERQTIAKIANCSLASVKLFIKKFEGIVISHKNRRDHQTKKHKSNIYHFCKDFFEYLTLFDAAGLLGRMMNSIKYNLKMLKQEIWTLYMQSEWFVHEMLYRNPLMNNDFSHGFLSKLATTKSYLLSILSVCKVLQGASSTNKKEELAKASQTDRRGFGNEVGILEGLPLTLSEKNKLLSVFGPISLKSAKEAFIYKNGDNDSIKNPGKFIFMTARAKTHEILKRKEKRSF